MARFLVGVFLFLTSPLLGQVLWFEDFEAEADGAVTGTAAGTIGGNWTATYGGAGTFSKQSPIANVFLVNDTDGEGVWQMDAPISIAATGRAIVEVTVVGFLVAAGDYIRCYYRVDGGPEILFFEQTGGILSFTLTGTAIVTGSNIQVVIRSTTNGDAFLGADSFTFNDVRVTGVNTVYSRKSGNWNDATVGNATWSLIALGGVSCDCTPIATDYVIVGNGNTVDLNVTGTAGGVEIQNASSIRYTANTVELNIDRGILQVDAGATINQNGQTGVQIDFDRGVITPFTNNGTITTETIEVTAANAMINITGGGSITLTGDFSILADDIIVDNDLSGAFAIGDDLIFDQPADISMDDAEFINRRTLTVTSDLVVGTNNDDGNTFTNEAGAILNVAAVNANNANFNISNEGTINQSGDFLNVVAASNFDNLATGIWNWNFVQAAFDAQMTSALDCSAAGNTFVYGAAGNQNIISVAYENLTFSGSGIKTTTNNLDINGNLLIAGTAQLNPNTGDDLITLAGNWTVTSTNANPFDEGTETVTLDGSAAGQTVNTALAGGETFNNLILANSFGTLPQYTFDDNIAVAAVLTMTSGTGNLNGSTLTLTSNAAGSLVYTSGWFYGGTMIRATQAGAIAVGAVQGLFPMGSSADTRPLYVGKPAATTAGNTTVVHDGTLYTTSDVSFADDVTITRRHDSFWTVVTTCTGGANTWALRAGGTTFGVIADITHLRLSTATGVVGTPGTNSGTPANPLVERTAISIADLNANQFHIASIDNVNSPLPIELLSLLVSESEGRVRVAWVTGSELNNDYFTIERTTDAENFEDVVQLKGQGTTTQQTAYEAYDYNPFIGVSYYRLRQTDFDGTYSFSPLERVVVAEAPVFAVYPNPVSGGYATLRVSGLRPYEDVGIDISDAVGRPMLTLVRKTDGSGGLVESLDTSKLATGIYLIELQGSTGRQVLRLVAY